MNADPVIGRRSFTDGVERDVYLDGDEGQYVLDDDGEAVRGVWVSDAEPDAHGSPGRQVGTGSRHPPSSRGQRPGDSKGVCGVE